MEYIELTCYPESGGHCRELLVAQLASIGFESFTEEDEVLNAYIVASAFTEKIRKTLETPEFKENLLHCSWQLIPDQNWNSVWEASYEPVRIGNQCVIRAPFHERPENIEFDILIEPKMSFGTAHHETTRLMIMFLLKLDIKGKRVLDMGSGTGVLAIVAAMRGAAYVAAVDNDEWAYLNAKENMERNRVEQAEVLMGDRSLLTGLKFDMILANINRNILMEDMESYRDSLFSGGTMLLSGFYLDDLSLLQPKALSLGLELQDQMTENRWTAACFKLNEQTLHP